MTTADKVRAIIAHELKRPIDEVTAEKCLFSDLGANDLTKLEIIMAAEDFFDVEFSDAESEGVTSVGGLVNLVGRKIGLSPP
jgi:acyl carrier protein